jgi:hypothetical protein
LNVNFIGRGGSVSLVTQGDGSSATISGRGPVNHAFLGTIRKITVYKQASGGGDGDLVLKASAGQTGAYYALDPPVGITSITPNTAPITGATVTIRGTGFGKWLIGTQTVLPAVEIGHPEQHDQIPFALISATDDGTTIIGNVGPTPSGVGTCAQDGQTPCKTISVINPGGFDGQDDLTSQPLLTISNPPPPVVTGTNALTLGGSLAQATSNSLGLYVTGQAPLPTVTVPVTAVIRGNNLSFVKTVTFGNQQVTVGPADLKSSSEIDVRVPAYCISTPTQAVNVIVYDGFNAPVTFVGGWIYTPTMPIRLVGVNVGERGNFIAYAVGQCENANITIETSVPVVGNPAQNYVFTDCSYSADSCVAVFNIPLRTSQLGNAAPGVLPNANIGATTYSVTCDHCLVPNTTYTAAFPSFATNSVSGVQSPESCNPIQCATGP